MIILKMKALNSPNIFNIIIEVCKSGESHCLIIYTFHENEKIVFNLHDAIFHMLIEFTKLEHEEIEEFIRDRFNIAYRNHDFYFNSYDEANEFLLWVESTYIMSKLTEA